MKRLVAVFCCVLLLCAGCTNTPADLSSAQPGGITKAPSASPDMLTLAFNREDTLDPFAAETQLNLCLSTLLYDSLVTLDDSFMPQNAMATVEQTDATHITATLNDDMRFSDGSAVTAQDVVYSFEQAKASANYKARLSNFASAAAKGKTVTFTLGTPHMYAVACLNFPIIKRNTATADAASAPIGSGRYIYNAETDTLTANTQTKHSEKLRFSTISLCHLVSNASVLQALENGTIQYMFNDLSDGDIPRTTAEDTAVDLPQLVYLGVNSSKALTNNADYRKALSSALDRTAIASAAYAGRALAATSPFHPDWKPAAGVSCFSAGSDTDTAASLLKLALSGSSTATTTATAAGTTATATTSTAATTAATSTATGTTAAAARTLTLIYPSGNSCRNAAVKMLVSQLSSAGIAVTASPLSYNDYISRLKAGNYDLYLGEIRLTPDMDLSAFLTAGGAAAYGVDAAGAACTAYSAFKSGGTADAFVTAFGTEMPYIPLCWLQGMAVCTLKDVAISPTAYALFNGLVN